MKIELKDMMEGELVEIKMFNNALICEMTSREKACEWLDLLLLDKDFKKKYSIKGQNYQVPKMKIYLDVNNIAKQ